MDDVKVAQEAALANVLSAVESALASAPAKRKPELRQPSMLPAKRQKASRHMLDLDADLSSDSEEEQGPASDAAPAVADSAGTARVPASGAAPTSASVADDTGQTAKGKAAVTDVVAEAAQVSALEASVPGSSSLGNEQEVLHSLVEPSEAPHSSSSELEAAPAAQATVPAQPTEVSASHVASNLLDMLGHVLKLPCQRGSCAARIQLHNFALRPAVLAARR